MKELNQNNYYMHCLLHSEVTIVYNHVLSISKQLKGKIFFQWWGWRPGPHTLLGKCSTTEPQPCTRKRILNVLTKKKKKIIDFTKDLVEHRGWDYKAYLRARLPVSLLQMSLPSPVGSCHTSLPVFSSPACFFLHPSPPSHLQTLCVYTQPAGYTQPQL
jgi:hypothetical protein